MTLIKIKPSEIKTAYQRLPEAVKSNVCFLGALERGKGEIIAKHDVALLNPTGASELLHLSLSVIIKCTSHCLL